MDRLKDWFVSCVRRALDRIPYAGTYRYSVTSCNFANQTIEAQSLSAEMPDLSRVPMMVPGLQLDIATGSEVGIAFFDLDPARPYVAAYPNDPTDVVRVNILGDAADNARKGDSVSITSAQFSAALPIADPITGAVTISSTMQGTISSGSDKVGS